MLASKESHSLQLEDFLTRHKLLDAASLSKAQAFMDENFCNLGTALMFLKLIDPVKMGQVLQTQGRVQFIRPSDIQIARVVRDDLTQELCLQLQVFPLNYISDSGQKLLLLAMTNPFDMAAVSKIEKTTGLRVQQVFMVLSDMQMLFQKYFKKGLELFPPEYTALNEEVAKRRLSAVDRRSASQVASGQSSSIGKSSTSLSPLQALVNLLIKKGLITQEELDKELSECY